MKIDELGYIDRLIYDALKDMKSGLTIPQMRHKILNKIVKITMEQQNLTREELEDEKIEARLLALEEAGTISLNRLEKKIRVYTIDKTNEV